MAPSRSLIFVLRMVNDWRLETACHSSLALHRKNNQSKCARVDDCRRPEAVRVAGQSRRPRCNTATCRLRERVPLRRRHTWPTFSSVCAYKYGAFLSSSPSSVSRDSLVVRTLRCGRKNPGSNPGHGNNTTLRQLFNSFRWKYVIELRRLWHTRISMIVICNTN